MGKEIEINGTKYWLEMNLGVSMEYEELTGNAWISNKKIKPKDIYQMIYAIFKANNENFNEDFRCFVNKTLTNNPWIVTEVTSMLFSSNTKDEEGEKKS